MPIHHTLATAIPAAVMADFIARSEHTWAEIALHMHWTHRRPRSPRSGDGARLKRAVGVMPNLTRGRSSYAAWVPLETAQLLATALDLGWWEVEAATELWADDHGLADDYHRAAHGVAA